MCLAHLFVRVLLSTGDNHVDRDGPKDDQDNGREDWTDNDGDGEDGCGDEHKGEREALTEGNEKGKQNAEFVEELTQQCQCGVEVGRAKADEDESLQSERERQRMS